jgi:LmbE family N-acetylglucosaminyl deacetylase
MDETFSGRGFLETVCSGSRCMGDLPHTVIIAAHPDDEVIGAGGILGRFGRVSFIHVTDGAPRDMQDAISAGFGSREAYAKARRIELGDAVRKAGIIPEHLWEAGMIDQDASYNLTGLSFRIADFLEKALPCVVLTHAYEGGHPDHDAVAFSTWAACCLLQKKKLRPPPVFEFASYHGNGGYEFITYEFIPNGIEEKIWTVVLSDEEKRKKEEMFECFMSQEKTLELFPIGIERFRAAPFYNFSKPPYKGTMLYEFYPWGMSQSTWLKLASDALDLLEIGEV